MSDTVTRLNAALEGRYHIEREVGEGGMATVYLAEDFKHRRKVALKLLRPELAAVVGAERFLTEIQTTANLQHPHILPLFDSGEADGFLFYVMPYVDGESLRERLRAEHQLPVEEALAIAMKVAAALQHAHEQGVVHRDIKPANVLLSGGEPLVSDFGIALAVTEAGGGRITETGLSMGTPHYMSPEQAAGERTLDRRSDVYALGCVVYEMLTGQPPYAGPTAQAVLGRILTADPTPPTEYRKAIPVNVEHAILKALQKLPADRFDTAADFMRALQDKAFRLDEHVGAAMGAASDGTGAWKPVAIGAIAVAALLGGLQVRALMGGGGDVRAERQRVVLGSDITEIPQTVSGRLALAPDGSGVLFADTLDPTTGAGFGYWWKGSGDADAVRIPNMDGAVSPVFSPDGEWVAYVLDGQLRKQPLRGGTTVLLADGVDAAGAQALAWLEGGVLIVENAGPILERISEDGVDRDTVADIDDTGYPVHASGLPGGGGALVTSCTDGTCTAYRLFLVDLQADTIVGLADEVLRAWPGPDGHVLYVDRQGAVYAARLDRGTARLDPPIPLFDGVAAVGATPTTAEMQIGPDGSLLYVKGRAFASGGFRAVWVDRGGRSEPVDPAWGSDALDDPALSPNDDRLALTIGGQVWVKELPDGPLSQITVEEGISQRPQWTRDGVSIVYQANTPSNHARIVRADGSSAAPDTLVVIEEGGGINDLLAPDDQGRVVFRVGNPARDIGYVDLSADATPTWLLDSEFDERGPALSPDGQWLAYTSNRSGRDEVYVRPFPEADRRISVSTNGGEEPWWGHSGEELFYRDGEGWMTSASVEAEPEFRVTARERLFDARSYRTSTNTRGYDVTLDDQRFVMLQIGDVQELGEADLILVENWFTEVREALRR